MIDTIFYQYMDEVLPPMFHGEAFIVKGDIETEHDIEIPLWYFGMNY